MPLMTTESTTAGGRSISSVADDNINESSTAMGDVMSVVETNDVISASNSVTTNLTYKVMNEERNKNHKQRLLL